MLKLSIFKFSIWAILLLSASTTASAGEESLGKENLGKESFGKESSEEDSLTRYDRRILRYRRHWDVLMPTQSVIQTCGNMGIISLGIGWDYGKRSQWETHLLFGIVPKYDSDAVKMTITLKENFIPWRKDWGKGWQFEPLECTLYLNTVLGHDFWTKQPTKYESGYYPFSTRIRPNLGFGERFTYQVPNNRRKRIKSLTFFYELSTNDIYFMRFYRNGNVLGYGRSIWAMIDTRTRQPVDILQERDGLITRYIESEEPCPIAPFQRVKVAKDAEIHQTIATHYSDVDVNGHINSVKYIEHILDMWLLSWFKTYRLQRIDIAYVAESYFGDTLHFAVEQRSDEEYDIMVLKSSDNGTEKKEVCRCKLKFVKK